MGKLIRGSQDLAGGSFLYSHSPKESMSLQIIFIISLGISSFFYIRENQLSLKDLLKFEHAKVVLGIAIFFTLMALIGNRKERLEERSTKDERLIQESEAVRYDFDDNMPGIQ